MSFESSPSGIFSVRKRVLCLDDDIAIARLVADVVSFCGHEPVIETNSIEAVLQHVRAGFGAAIVDQLMPGVTGLEVLMSFQQVSPNTRRILFTAAPQLPEVRAAVADGTVNHLLVKPADLQAFRLALAWL